jgi:L-serine dehydratase
MSAAAATPASELTFAALLDQAKSACATLPQLARAMEARASGLAAAQLDAMMAARLGVMREAVARGTQEPVISRSGLTGGDGHRMWQAIQGGGAMLGLTARAVARALGAAEVNAAMGRIVAAPTAGSSGVIPGVLLTVGEHLGSTEAHLIDALWVAGLVGQVIQTKQPLSGAQGGCQAECGAAAAMAAAGACHLAGGSPEACVAAVAIALKNQLGLVCDPVAGLVEVPCVKRNAGSAGIALVAAELALAGVRSVIPADEVISAMRDVGRAMPAHLRETGEGGLAATPTGRRLARELSKG